MVALEHENPAASSRATRASRVLRAFVVVFYLALALFSSAYVAIALSHPARWLGYEGDIPFGAMQLGVVVSLLVFFWRASWRLRPWLAVMLPIALVALIALLPLHHNCGPCG